MTAAIPFADSEMEDWGRRFRDGFSNREMAFFLFDEPDYDAQQRAIRSILSLRKKADEEFEKGRREIEAFIETAKGAVSDRGLDEWVDHLHDRVFVEAAHSMAAVGMLAPFIESLFTQAYLGIQRLFEREGLRLAAPRCSMRASKRWDPHFKAAGGKNLVDGIFELAAATDLTVYLPPDLRPTLEALYMYRNRNFHHGFEWPMPERMGFSQTIIDKNWPSDWFDKSATGGNPWILYLSDSFVRNCLDMIENLLERFGAFYRDKSR